ncbi:MAG: hypothetical protein PHI23_02505 [Candidatus Peribacteraceae bacterium]|nr:hypothetical protein [Candidatus Peribacteraceae bacterium]
MPSKRKLTSAVVALALLLWLQTGAHADGIIGIHAARAADLSLQDSVFTTLALIFSYFVGFAHFLVYLCIDIIGTLLDPNFIDLKMSGEGTHTMAEVLNKIWQLSRNITNILLAFLLIAGAIVTVITADSHIVSTYAKKFIIAIILVNFSWFFPRVILDLANILTATVYAIPSEIRTECKTFPMNGDAADQPCEVITKVCYFEKGDCTTCPLQLDAANPLICIKTENMNADANSPNAILSGLVYNHGRLKFLPMVVKSEAIPGNPAAPNKAMARLSQQIVFIILLMFVMFCSVGLLFPLLAMMIAFLIRIPIIWITVAFMPFMFVGFVIGDKMKGLDTMEMLWKRFLSAAFMPVLTALPFAVGFIMINAAMSVPPSQAFVDLNKQTGIPLLGGVNSIWQLLWVFMSFVIIWVGVFMALEANKDVAAFVAPIKQSGKSFGAFLGKLPLLWPLPFPGAAGVTPLQAFQYVTHPNEFFQQGGAFHNPFRGGGAAGAGGAGADAAARGLNRELVNKFEQAMQKINAAEAETQRNGQRELREIMIRHGRMAEGNVTTESAQQFAERFWEKAQSQGFARRDDNLVNRDNIRRAWRPEPPAGGGAAGGAAAGGGAGGGP